MSNIPTKPAPDKPPVMLKVQSYCKHCKSTTHHEIPASGLKARRQGMTVEKAFPTLAVEEHMRMTNSVCPKCQEHDHGSSDPLSVRVSKTATGPHITDSVSVYLAGRHKYASRRSFLAAVSSASTRAQVMAEAAKYLSVQEV